MTQKEAKIEALRSSVAWLNSGLSLDYENKYTIEEEEKITKEKRKIIQSLRNRAERIGGDFNEYTGF